MAGNRTLAIIKPDAFGAGKAGKIIAHLEGQGFSLVCARVLHMSRAEAEAFYEVHRGRPFYAELVAFMSSGPCMPLLLQKDDAVATYRAAIGATDPAEAAEGTVRKLYAESKGRNAVHGSDSDENARHEGMFFFGSAALV
jgi:nucleoside-diphosphate kinase